MNNSRCALEELVLAYRRINADVKARLRISASPDMLDRMVDESFARGLTPDITPRHCKFGPALLVYLDRDLPDDTFRIAVLK